MRRPSYAAPLAALACLVAAAGCARCGAPRTHAAPAGRFVASGAVAALLAPRLDEAARQAAALQGALVERPGAGDLATLRAALGAQLGVDLLDPASLAGAGLDPERGLAIALLPPAPGAAEPQPLLVLPAGDAGKLQAVVDRLARDRLGAGDPVREPAGGLTTWRRAPGEPALLALAFAEGSALLAPGPAGPEAVRGALRLDPSGSLEQAPAWRQGLAALGEAPALLAWLPPGTASPRGLPALAGVRLPGGLVAGVSASARGLRLVAASLLGAEEARWRPLAAREGDATRPLAVPAGAAVALRLSADPAAALALLGGQLLPPLDPLAPLAAAVAAPLDAGLSLAPGASLGRLLAGREDDLLRVVELAVSAPLAAGRGAEGALGRAAGAERGADGTWRVRLGAGEAAWAVRDGTLRLQAGPASPAGSAGRPFAEAPGALFTAPTPAAAAALSGGLGGAVLHLDNLAAALRALPPSAFGAGPDAVVARSLALKLLALPGRGAAASLRADLPAGALRVALELELGAPPGAAP